MQIRHVEVDQRRFQQIVDLRIFVDKRNQFSHALRQRLPGKARVLHLCTDHIHAVMPVEMTGQQPILLGEIGSDSHFIEPVNGLLGDLVRRVADELQSLFHAKNAAFAFVCWCKAGKDLADAVAGEVHLLDGEGGHDLLLHSLDPVKLRAVLRRQKHLGSGKAHLRNAAQIDDALPGEILERQRMIEAVFQQLRKLFDVGLREFIAELSQIQNVLVGQHLGKQCSIHESTSIPDCN